MMISIIVLILKKKYSLFYDLFSKTIYIYSRLFDIINFMHFKFALLN